MSENYFAELYAINVNKYVEKKNGLSYVSWPFAWGEVKKLHPDATYTIYENADGLFYHTDGRTCWVKTGVTVNGVEHIEYLPVMDFKNRSIPVEQVTSFDVNKAMQKEIDAARLPKPSEGFNLLGLFQLLVPSAKAKAQSRAEKIKKILDKY